MFAKFNLDISEISKLKDISNLRKEYGVELIDPDDGRSLIREHLKSLVKGKAEDNNVIDGNALKDYIFPIGKDGSYDVFISYSHADTKDAIFLASWLSQQCGLKVFLDYYVWGSADGLLRDIDNQYCKKKDGHYDYKRRNYSTSHVHAMLSMAIMDIINNTECCIFINSKHSISLSRLQNTNTAKTLSPWIYEENKMMQLLPSRGTRKEVKNFSLQEKAASDSLENLKIVHHMSLDGFENLTCAHLIRMKDKGENDLYELYKQLQEGVLSVINN